MIFSQGNQTKAGLVLCRKGECMHAAPIFVVHRLSRFEYMREVNVGVSLVVAKSEMCR